MRGIPQRVPAHRKSTNPISTKCTARNPCPSAPPEPPCRKNPSATAARSSSPPTPASPARSSARPHAPAAARRGIGAGGRRGRQTGLLFLRTKEMPVGQNKARRAYSLKVVIPVRSVISARFHAASFETSVRNCMDTGHCGRAFQLTRHHHGQRVVHASHAFLKGMTSAAYA